MFIPHEFSHIPDFDLFHEYGHSMEGIDQTYIEWLESELKTARPFVKAFERVEKTIIERGINIDTKEFRKYAGGK